MRGILHQPMDMNTTTHHLVSIIVPHYNRNGLIPDLIRNIVVQEYRPIEIIIVDDGSDDPLLDVDEDHGDVSVRILNLSHTGCPGLVRNAGIQAARGEFIAFLDSDDLWLPQKLRLQIEVFEKNPRVDLCHSNALIKQKGTLCKLYRHLSTGHQVTYGELLRENLVLTSSVVAKKKVFMAEQFSNYPSAQDYEYWLRLVRKFKLYYLAEPLYVYADSRQDSVSRKVALRYLNLLKIFRLQQPFCVERKQRAALQLRMSGFYFKLAKYSFLRGRVVRCRSLLLVSLRCQVTVHAVVALALLILGPRILGKLYARNPDM